MCLIVNIFKLMEMKVMITFITRNAAFNANVTTQSIELNADKKEKYTI